ncbi:uncharacterized protein [Temnothorax nylanderi]|uniref:uncharacterized protein n=1 Tax=Temnothorax nylanderi TaxID=102681 RepID=UPI003A84AA17
MANEKELTVLVNDELWTLNVSEIEFLAATTGNEDIIKLLIEREREKRSMAMIEQLEQHSLEGYQLVDASEINNEQPVDASEINNEVINKKESFTWPDKAVLLLLEIYRNKESEFAGLKRHNKIWNEISNEMKEGNYNVTGTQCQNKMSGLKRTYKNITDSNKKSGNHSSSWAFYSAMDSIFGEKAWVDPVSIASSDNPPSPGSFSEKSSSISEKLADRFGLSMTAEEPKPKKRRVESILESFIYEMKEEKQKEKEDRERRTVGPFQILGGKKSKNENL